MTNFPKRLDAAKHLNAFYNPNRNLLNNNRLAHSIGVANFLYTYGLTHNYSAKDTQNLYLMGLLHDIGYLDNPSGANHAAKGSDILRRNGFHQKFTNCIRFHGKVPEKQPISKNQKLLWLGDLCINHRGDFVGYHTRFQSISLRYKSDDRRYQNVKRIIDILEKEFPEYK